MKMLPLRVDISCAVAGLIELCRRIGIWRALVVGISSEFVKSPFAGFEPAADERERASRKQILPAVKLYIALRKKMSEKDSLDTVEAVVNRATQVFLDFAVGRVDPADWKKMSDAERSTFAGMMADRFFNATGCLGPVRPEGFEFTVNRCRFPELCRDAGVPELAPVFCNGDLKYFSEGPIRLARTTTLSADGKPCDFKFTIGN